MSAVTIAERIRIESQILSFVREALIIALEAPIDEPTADQWCERVRFLTDSFRRHVERLFRIKWEVDDESLLIDCEHPDLIGDLRELESQQRDMLAELNMLTGEVHTLSCENIANLHAYHQRLVGFMERFDEIRLREYKIWLDAYEIDIGGEG